MDMVLIRKLWPCLAALLSGAALTAAFAPHDLWWLALAAPAVLAGLWARATSPRQGAWLGFLFGLGLYATGTWWLYISIRVLGQAPVWVALLVMAALVLIMAAYQAGLGYVAVRWLAPHTPRGAMLLVPAAWVLVEWWRGWFLSGFPWLSLGYSQTDTWLAGLAPLGGVHLLSLVLIAGGGAVVMLLRQFRSTWPLALVVLVLPWTAGVALRNKAWTQPVGEPLTVALLQGAIPQDMKWLDSESNRQRILDEYAGLHRASLGAKLIVWPESALPDLANLFADYIGNQWSLARARGSAVLMGIMREEQQADGAAPLYFNSLLAMDASEPAFYDKRHLVPFGEYFPVPQWVRSWLRLMSLPYSDFNRGRANQPPLMVAGQPVSVSICYEDAYPEQLRAATRASTLLVTVTNDAWFGHSGARYQHLQIARMRALESRRYLLRAANDGVSAVIDQTGRVVRQAPEFQPAVLRGVVQPRSGATPYLRVGDWPLITLLVALLLPAAAGHLKKARWTRIKKH